MKIWIDGYEANVLQRLGSSQVAYELLKNFEKIDKKNDYTILLPSPPLEDLPKDRPGWKYKILKPKKLWTRISLPLALVAAKKKPDIFFSPTHYIPRFCPKAVKRICIIFDLSFLHFPEMFTKKDLWQLKNWTKFSAENADRIITISHFSKQDIVSQYKVDKNKIIVAYPGFDKERFKHHLPKDKIGKIKRRYQTGNSYIIYIGTIQPRKNISRLIESFKNVVNSLEEDLKLIIVGKADGEERGGWMYEDILKMPEKLEIEEKVRFTGFAENEDLPYLLAGSKSFILPSLWEGFGIPVIEAMAVGVPVIVSNVSSLPEVAGKAGLLVDPYSLDQIEQAIRTVAIDKKLGLVLSKKALKQANKFSWEKMARTILKSFSSI